MTRKRRVFGRITHIQDGVTWKLSMTEGGLKCKRLWARKTHSIDFDRLVNWIMLLGAEGAQREAQQKQTPDADTDSRLGQHRFPI